MAKQKFYSLGIIVKVKILVSFALGVLLFVGCGGDKPKEEKVAVLVQQKTEINSSATQVIQAKEEPKAFDAVSVFATKCAGCHGAKGEGKSMFPKLTSQSKADIVKKLKGYKDGSYGKDKKAMMIPNASNLSEEEIEKIAQVVVKF